MTYQKALLDLTFFEVEDVITTSEVVTKIPSNFPVVDLPNGYPDPAPQPPMPPEPEPEPGQTI